MKLADINALLPYKACQLEKGFKYLGYFLKPNGYKTYYWSWLLTKFENRIHQWTYRLLSMGGRHTLKNAVLTRIPIYLFSLRL